jgi:hypothetical protein
MSKSRPKAKRTKETTMSKSRPKAKRTPERKTTQAAAIEEIEVGYAPVRLLQVDGLADSGHFVADRQVIGVDTNQLPADQLNTLFHELTHTIAQRFRLDISSDAEEHLSQVFGNAWAEIFIRNPGLLPLVGKLVEEARAVRE